MTDWVGSSAAAATAVGTLVLAVATFSAVRSSQRAARATEAALLAAIRPVLVPSRPDDPVVDVGFVDGHWLPVGGGRGDVQVTEDVVYLAISVRNAGNGLAVLDRWDVFGDRVFDERSAEEVASLRRLTRDIYVPAGEAGFWQGAIRDRSDPRFAEIAEAVAERRAITVDILYGDHDGGQRTISRFGLFPVPEGPGWTAAVARHWNLDRPDPRRDEERSGGPPRSRLIRRGG